MTEDNYNKIKKFVLSLPRDKWIIIDSIPKLTPKSRELFIEGCKLMIESQDYNGETMYLSFSNDYNQIRLFEDIKTFSYYSHFKN